MIAVAEQVLNGVQFGLTLFLMAAGLTLIFGVMNLVNLAHGSLYMIGAFLAAATFNAHFPLTLDFAASLVALALAVVFSARYPARVRALAARAAQSSSVASR